MTFEKVLNTHPWEETLHRINACTAIQVQSALSSRRLHPPDLMALLSPAAEPFLEEMALKAREITRHRFGRVIQLYVPLYLSNECTNACVYCGFSRANQVQRRTLTLVEASAEADLLLGDGFRHLLLVAGESPKHVDARFIAKVAENLSQGYASLSIEVQPLSYDDYCLLIDRGVDGLVSYQETYNRETYAACHPTGPKRNFSYRLDTAERGGDAGFRRVGIGALLGLSDWRAESFFLGLHGAFLQKKYWRTQVAVSFPRLRPCAGGFSPPCPVDDRALVQLIAALRLFLPDAVLVLSTRERAELREHLIPIGITQMSAGSRTEPGGYAHSGDAEGQFEVHDTRPALEVAAALTRLGFEPVWKDWDAAFLEKQKGTSAAKESENNG